jgi:hypothetical protein
VYHFENGACVQTLEVKNLVNEKAPALPQESTAPVAEVSADAARYFSRLRDRHAEAAAAKPSPAYSLLRRIAP